MGKRFSFGVVIQDSYAIMTRPSPADVRNRELSLPPVKKYLLENYEQPSTPGQNLC